MVGRLANSLSNDLWDSQPSGCLDGAHTWFAVGTSSGDELFLLQPGLRLFLLSFVSLVYQLSFISVLSLISLISMIIILSIRHCYSVSQSCSSVPLSFVFALEAGCPWNLVVRFAWRTLRIWIVGTVSPKPSTTWQGNIFFRHGCSPTPSTLW